MYFDACGIIVVFFALCNLTSFAASQREFLIEPIPDWPTSVGIIEQNNPLEKQAAAGVFTLLFQVEINAATRERYIRVAQKFLTTAGVEANSRLSFSFDPAYQHLVLHKIVLHRGEQVLNRLDPDQIRVIQQEKDLDRLIYNGTKTALIFLEDVRVGDWLEYAYTVRGRNPIEAGHFFDSMQLRYSFPIQSECYRFLWPSTNQPVWAQTTGDVSQNRNIIGPFVEYAWRWENRRGQEMEDFVPAGTVQYASVHFSDYKNWREVAKWAEKSFHPERVSESLYQKIIKIRDESQTNDERVLNALQFVQDDIRYLGIENGINSHQPTDPSVVFARGYGDCKDKALLFCTMLRFFEGVDASPVLVSTRFLQSAKHFMATPLLFDHAIVRVIVGGKTNFVDVTRSFQRGPLERRFIDYFGAGVLVDSNAPGLIDIPATNAGMPQTRIVEEFDLSATGAATLTVNSTFEGRDADFIRRGRALRSEEAIEENVLALYKKYYGDAVATARPALRDDQRQNTIQVTRRYSIANIWKPAVQTNHISCEFVTYGIFDRLYIPAKKERKWPLAVSFPENYIHTMRIRPHEPWRIVPREKKIQTKELLFNNRLRWTNDEIEVTCQILNLRYGVDAREVPDYCATLDEIPRYLGLAITKPMPGVSLNDSPNWSIWMAAISYSIVLLIAAGAVYRLKPKSPPEICEHPTPNLAGLGGWLILLGFALLIAPLIRINVLIRIGPLYSMSNWHTVTDVASSSYDSMLAPLLLYELFLQLTLLVFSILIIVLFFQKRRIFKAAVIIYLSLQFVGDVVDRGLSASRKPKGVMTHTRSTAASSAGGTLVPLVIWGLYILRSRRVKYTFVN